MWVLADLREGAPENPALIYALLALLVVMLVGWIVWTRWRRHALSGSFEGLLTRGRFTEIDGPPPPAVLRCVSLYYKTTEYDERSRLRAVGGRVAHARADGLEIYVLVVQPEGQIGTMLAGHESVAMVVVTGLDPAMPGFLLRPNSGATRLLIAMDKNALPSRDPLAAANHVETHEKDRVRELLREGPARALLLGNRHWHIDLVEGTMALHCESHYLGARQLVRMADDALRLATAFRERFAQSPG